MGNILVLILEVEDHQFPHHFVHKHTEINHTCKPTKSNYQFGIFMVQIKSRSTNELFEHVSPSKRKDNRLKRRIRKVIEIQCSPTLETEVLNFQSWHFSCDFSHQRPCDTFRYLLEKDKCCDSSKSFSVVILVLQ